MCLKHSQIIIILLSSIILGGQGSWREFLTLPNILKIFNPNLIGYALGDSFSYHDESQFNVAEARATSKDLPFMARILVKKLQQDARVNLQDDWKVRLASHSNSLSRVSHLFFHF